MGLKEQNPYTKEASQVNTGNTQKQNGLSLNELTPGKVFAGEVVQVDNNKVLLKLENGQTIQASLNGDIRLQEGQMVAFQVKANTGKQLAIKPILDVALGNSSVLKALENAGLPVNKKNAELVNLLMKEQQPIDKKTIMKYLRQMLLNPETDVKTLVKLQRMGLPVTEENIAKFEGFKNHEYRLAGEIKTVASQVAQLLGESVEQQTAEMSGKVSEQQMAEMSGKVSEQQTAEMSGKMSEQQMAEITEKPVEQQIVEISGKPMEQQMVETSGKLSRQQVLEIAGKSVEQQAVELSGKSLTKQGTENIIGSNNSVETFGKIIDIIFPKEERIMDFQKNIAGDGSKTPYGTGEKAEGWRGGPVLYDNLKSEAMLKNNGENLTDIQKQALENIEVVVERFNGQESEIEHIIESLKNLNEEAEGVLKALEENVMSEKRNIPKGDVIARLFEAFEMYEAAEKSMEAAKAAVNGKETVLEESKDGKMDSAKEMQFLFREEGLKGILDEGSRMVLAQKMQKAGGDIFTYLQVRNGEMSAEELVFMVKNMLEGDNPKLPEIKELLQSNEFQKVLENAIEEQLLLKPEELAKENVKKYYERLDAQMEKLSDLMQQMGKAETSAMKNTATIRQNVDYINQLNQLYSYVQLPVKLTTQNAHSELYVMTNKKRLRENDGTFTALLHLDMELLGSMDVYITMEQKNVNTKFYLQNEGIAEFLRTHSEAVIQRLEEKGFHVTAGFEKRKEEKNVVDEFMEMEPVDGMVGKYSFDIRT